MNARKSYGSHVVFSDISFVVQDGEIVGLSGPSGGGKTTLLRCIQGLESLDSGSIELNGVCGFMFQDFNLSPHMNVLDNLCYAPRLNKHEYFEKESYFLLESLGVADKRACFPGELSGGQKQRVALARSLMMKPKVLLCDEPTSGLNDDSIDDVVSILKTLKNKGITMIVSSHNLSFIYKLCDRVITLENGWLRRNSRSITFNPQEYV